MSASGGASLALARASTYRRAAASGPSNIFVGFILFQIGCQIALLIPQIGVFRPVLRVAAFGISLVLLLLLPAKGALHPSAKVGAAVLAIVGIEFFHPLTNNFLAGAAQFLMYVAILGPIFWVRSCKLTLARFRKALLVLWAFHLLSCMVGILQVRYPGHLQANVTSSVTQMGSAYLSGLQIRTASGEYVFRPMGLTDSPGGAAVSGYFAALLSVALALEAKSARWKGFFILGLFPALACLYLAQVRMYLVMTAVCLAALYVILLLRGEKKMMLFLSFVVPACALASLIFATALGGSSVTDRLKSFTQGSPGNVYYKSRGFLLEYTITEYAPQHPLGLGLGRWGMIYKYFGSDKDPEKGMIWAEIQWTAWVIDGGIPLVLVYVAAIAAAIVVAFRLAFVPSISNQLWLWAAFVGAYDLGAFAATFTSSFFISEGGMEFWALNAALFSVSLTSKRKDSGLSAPDKSFSRAPQTASRLSK